MAKELDKDLNMIDGPTPSEKKVSRWAENFAKVNPTPETPAPTNIPSKSAAEDMFSRMQKKYITDSSVQAGSHDIGLDEGKSIRETENAVRSRNQSTGIKALKAFSGGILQGGLVALEQLAYIGDIDSYANIFRDLDDYSGNQWAESIQQFSQELGESDMFKIYEEEDPNSIVGQIFKWNSVKSGLSSAVGFGATSHLAARAVAALGSLGKFNKIAGKLDEVMGNMKGKEAYNKAIAAGKSHRDAQQLATNVLATTQNVTSSIVSPLATSAISNFYMGQMMAADTYHQSLDSLSPYIGKELPDGTILTREQAEKMANQEAGDVVTLNMAMTSLAYLKFKNIFRRGSQSKSIVSNPTLGWQAKEFIKTGSPSAFVENVYQEMIQMEQIHDTQVGVGIPDVELSGDYWERMSQLALSDRAIHAGALGMAGGPMQFAIIQRPFMGKQIAQQKKTYEAQQPLLDWQTEVVKNNFAVFNAYEKNAVEALKNGKIKEAEFIDDASLINQIVETVNWGTADSFKNDLKNIAKMKPEIATNEENKFDENYKETAEKTIALIEKAQYYNMIEGSHENKNELIHTRLLEDRLSESVADLISESIEKDAALVSKASNELGLPIKHVDGRLTIERADNRFDALTEKQKEALKSKEAKENQKLLDFMNLDADFKDAKSRNSSLQKYEKLLNKLRKKYKHLLTDEGIAEYKAKREQAVNKIKKGEATETTKSTKEKESYFTSFDEIKEAKPNLSDEELRAQQKEWNEELAANPNERAVITEDTFSGIDDHGTSALYTPGELRRSHDGRYFVIEAQNNVKSNFGEVKGEMPIAYETNEKGFKKKGAKRTVIRDNAFFRDEVKQIQFAKGKYKKRKDIWAPYVSVDSTIAPNDYRTQSTMAEFAAEGKLRSKNVSGRNAKKPEFEWMANYNMHLINLPFEGDYQVTLKRNDDGGPNETYIDVYTEIGGKESLLTRLDKDYNLGHADLLGIIDKNGGSLPALVTEHYSSRANFNKNVDENGVPILSNVSELRNMPESFKVNGELVLISHKGDRAVPTFEVARSESGKVYDTGVIDVEMQDGTIVPMDIPYSSILPGQTAVLIRSTSGKNLMPLILQTSRIGDMPGKGEGETFVDELTTIHESAVNEVIDELLEGDADAFRDSIKKKIVDEGSVAESGLDFAVAKRMTSELIELDKKSKKIIDILDRTVYEHVRPRFDEYLIEGKSNGKNTIVKAKNAAGKRVNVVNPNYFAMSVGVSSTGTLAPQIKIRRGEFQPEGRTSKDEGFVAKNKFSFEYINFADNPTRYKEVLSMQKKRASISVLANENKTSGQDAIAEMNEFMDGQGLKTDLNVNNPVIGSSLTLVPESTEYAEASALASNKHHKKVASKFAKYNKYKEETMEESPEEVQESIDEAVEDINDILSDKEEVLSSIQEYETDIEVNRAIQSMVNKLNIYQDFAAVKIVKDFFSNLPEGMETQLADTIEELKSKGITKYQDTIAKGVLALKDIKTKLKDGVLKIKPKEFVYNEADPTGKFVQQENFVFKRNTEAYHDTHGPVIFLNQIVTSGKNKGKYRVKKISNNKIYTVYPSEVFRKDLDLAQLSVLKKQLNKVEAKTPKFEALDRKRLKLEAKIKKRNDYLNGKTTKSGESTASGDGTKLLEMFEETAAIKRHVKAVESISSGERADLMVNYLKDLDKISEDLIGKGVADPFPEGSAESLYNALKKIPYSVRDIESLLAIAERNKEKGINPEQSAEHIADLEAALNMREAITEMDDFSVSPQFDYKKKRGSKLVDRTLTIPGTSRVNLKGETVTTSIDYAQPSIDGINKIVHGLIAADVELRFNMWASTPTPVKKEKPVNKNISTTEVDNLVTEVTANSEFIVGKKDGKEVPLSEEYDVYLNTETGTELKRTSTVVYGPDYKPTGEYLDAASTIGRKSDKLWRDIMDGDQVAYGDKYGIADKKQFKAYVEEVAKFKAKLEARGEKVIAKEVVVYDEKNKFGGTLDLLTYTKNGKFKIYDMKTMRQNKYVKNEHGFIPYEHSYSKGVKSNYDAYIDQMSLYRIALFNTHGILAESDITVLPTQIDYKPDSTMGMNPKFLGEKVYKARDVVEGIALKGSEPRTANAKEKFPSEIKSTTDRPFLISKAEKYFPIPLDHKFQTVAGAFAAAKMLKDDSTIYFDTEYNTLTTAGTKLLEQLANADGNSVKEIADDLDADSTWGKDYMQKMLTALLVDSYSQNKAAKNNLLKFDIGDFKDVGITEADYKLALLEAKEQLRKSGKATGKPKVYKKKKKKRSKKVKKSNEGKTTEEVTGIVDNPAEKFENSDLKRIAADYTISSMPRDVFNKLESLIDTTVMEEYLEDLDATEAIGGDVNKVYQSILKDKGSDQSEVPYKLRADATVTSPEAFKIEVAKAKAMLPQVPIEIVEDVATMVRKYGVKAVGSFDQGVRYVVNNFGNGTVYHETFHAVAGLYLSASEKAAIAKEEGAKEWNIAFEEKMAENFEAYVRAYKKPTLGQRILRFFKKLLWWRDSAVPSEIERVYEKTVTGGYANMPSISDGKAKNFESVENFSSALSDKNSLTLHKLIGNNRIKIVC